MYGERVHQAPPTEGPYYIIHLYSGRRRSGDFQDWMEHYLLAGGFHNIHVLSVDTAVDPEMNIHNPKLWTFLMDTVSSSKDDA